MKYRRLEKPKPEDIQSNRPDLFMIHDFKPLYIRKPAGINMPWSVLFRAHQTLEDQIIYFYFFIDEASLFDIDFLRDNSWNRDNLTLAQKKAMEPLTIDLSRQNLFATDFMFPEEDQDMVDRYKTKMYRIIDQNKQAEITVSFSKETYYQLQLFLKDFLNGYLWNLEYFDSKPWAFIPSVTIKQIKLNGTTLEVHDQHTAYVGTHYTMNHGPAEFRMNFTFRETQAKLQGRIIREPLDSNIYRAEYGQDQNITKYFYEKEKDILHVFYAPKNDSIYDLRLKKEIYEQTNILDPFNYIFSNTIVGG